jgi:hypothetical protein
MSRLPMPEKKPPPFRLVRFIAVPRAVAGVYGDRTWVEVVTAAQAGRDGLEVIDTDYFGLPQAKPDTAWLREGPSGGCLLYLQNWRDETNDARWRRVP